jgi:hypothetical protein
MVFFGHDYFTTQHPEALAAVRRQAGTFAGRADHRGRYAPRGGRLHPLHDLDIDVARRSNAAAHQAL